MYLSHGEYLQVSADQFKICQERSFCSLNQRSPAGQHLQVTIDQFKVLMEEALARTRGIPRSYLLPSPAQRLEDAQLTFKPRITQRSEVGSERQSGLRLFA